MQTAQKDIKPQKPLPPPNSDFYQLAETLPPEELANLRQVRSFMESKVAPIINKYWVEDSFPFELLPQHTAINSYGHSRLKGLLNPISIAQATLRAIAAVLHD